MKKSGLIRGNDRLAEVIHSDFRVLSVLRRFNINLGFGDSSISEICRNYKLNENFVLEILNMYIDIGYFPAKKMQSFSIKLITDFLKSSHHYYNNEKILSIESKINELVWNSPDHDRNLSILKKFFNEYKNEVKTHTDQEEEQVYPYAIDIEESCINNKNIEKCIAQMQEYSITNYAQEHDDIEDKLTDLKNIIIKYLPAPREQEILHEILNELFLLQNDLINHARIEEKILVPKILEMEEKLKSQINF